MDALHEHINRWTMKEHGNLEHFCGIDQYSLCFPVSVGTKNTLDLLVDMGQVRLAIALCILLTCASCSPT